MTLAGGQQREELLLRRQLGKLLRHATTHQRPLQERRRPLCGRCVHRPTRVPRDEPLGDPLGVGQDGEAGIHRE